MPWQIDQSHSSVQFSARHLMISKVRGRFNSFTGSIDIDEQNPSNSWVEVQIDASSLETRDEKRDAHLRSPDFLNVEQFPYITFKSTRVEQIDENSGRIYGDLTIRGETNEVVLDVEFNGLAKAPWGVTSAGFAARTKISRQEWGLTWNVSLETGGVLVGDEITIDIELEVVKVEVPVEESVAAV